MNANMSLCMLCVLIVHLHCMCPHAQNVPPRTVLRMSGTANGGNIVVAPVQFTLKNAKYFKIETSPGLSASDCLDLLETKLNGHNIRIDSNSLKIPRLHYISGSDCGFSLPASPKCLSAAFDPSSRSVQLRWINPPGAYDRIVIYRNGPLTHIDGSETSYLDVLSTDEPPSQMLLLYIVMGIKDNAASGLGLLQLDLDGHCIQSETGDSFFKCGIANNWLKWDASTNGNIELSEGQREIVFGPLEPWNKSRYQVVAGEGANFKGGAYREFLGLTPSHEYKVMFRILNPGLLDTDDTWSFSLHAAANAATGDSLTSNQLAGAEPLPDGTTGVNAGQIARFSGTSGGEVEETSDDMWVQYTTEDATPSRRIGNITLPANVTKLTVWFRYEGSGEVTGTPAIEWIGLEDKSCQLTP